MALRVACLAVVSALLLAGCASDAGGPQLAAQAEPSDDAPFTAETTRGDVGVFYPVPFRGGPAKEAVHLDLSGELAPTDCEPTGHLFVVSKSQQFVDLREHLELGDAFSYSFQLSYNNSPTSWAEMHPALGIGNTYHEHTAPVRESTEPIMIRWSGQSYYGDEADLAFLFVQCAWGNIQTPIPYTMTLSIEFASRGVPAETPFVLSVPEGARELIVRPVPSAPGESVLSHFRVFSPQGELVCECALSTTDAFASVPLSEAGNHVVMVDHTDGGYVELALDAPAPQPLYRAPVGEVETLLASSAEPLAQFSQALEFDLTSPPLLMFIGVRPAEGQVGLSKAENLVVALQNERGTVATKSWGGYVAATWPMIDHQMNHFYPTTAQGWDGAIDHHLFAGGSHLSNVQADSFQGEIFLITRHFDVPR